MLLRASGEISGHGIDVSVVKDDNAADASGIPHARALLAFTEAVVRGSEEELAAARAQLLDELGAACLVDAAAVVGNFERMVRIADATGIPLDSPVEALTQDLRSVLGLAAFGSSANTPGLGPVARILGRGLEPASRLAFRAFGAATGRRKDD
jgi:DNA-binding phage protein